MRKNVPFLLLTLLFVLMLGGCRVVRIEEESAQPISYTIVDTEDIPRAAMSLIEEKKSGEFRLTYQSGEDLYLIKGYGTQMTGGYSVQINELSASSTGIFFRTSLLGPEEKPLQSEPSYPYIVVKIADLDLPVQFEEGTVREGSQS